MSQTKNQEPVVTLKSWAANTAAKKKLMDMLEDPVMKMAIDLISRESIPTTKVQKLDGVSFMESVAMTNTYRAGAHEAIAKLKSLPFIILQQEDRTSLLGRPYEWLGSEEDKKLVKEKK